MYIVRKEKKEVEVIVEQYNTCDKCNKRIKYESFEDFDCSLTYRSGHSYPEGFFGKNYHMDICQDCADEFLELLKENGYKLNEGEG